MLQIKICSDGNHEISRSLSTCSIVCAHIGVFAACGGICIFQVALNNVRRWIAAPAKLYKITRLIEISKGAHGTLESARVASWFITPRCAKENKPKFMRKIFSVLNGLDMNEEPLLIVV